MTLLATGGFMLMPFGSASCQQPGHRARVLPTIYLITGVFTIFIGPAGGQLADRQGKYPVFLGGSILSIVMVLIYTHLRRSSLTVVIVVNVVLFAGIFSRIIPFQAMVDVGARVEQTRVVHARCAAIQQVSAGRVGDRRPHRHDGARRQARSISPVVGYVVVCATLVTLGMMYFIQRQVAAKIGKPAV